MLVGDIVRLNGLSRGADPALVVDGGRYTYGELDVLVRQVSAALRGSGVRKGDRVAVLGKNSLEYVLLYFATASIGAVLVPLNFWHRTKEHAYTLADSSPVLLFVESELRASLGELSPDLRLLAMPAGTNDRGDWQAFLDSGRTLDGEPATDVHDDDPHMILYTSGTTGRPKGAVLSHRRTVDDAMAMAAVLQPLGSDTFINYFPPFHVGSWDHMKVFLLVGARVIVLRQFHAGQVLGLVASERITVVLGVPTMLHDLLSHPDFPQTDISSIRLLYYGAYDPSGIMQRTAEVLGARAGRVKMAHTFGLTEGGPFVTLCAPEHVFSHWGSIGRPLPGIELVLLDEDGSQVPEGSAGELCFKGPRMLGYWNNPEASAKALEGGWLHTGDIATRDADGFYYIVDRKKDMIRSGGQNVYSKEVEDCLLEHEAVLQVGVIGLPDDRYEESVCAVVVLAEGVAPDEATTAQLQAWVRTHLAGYNTPRHVEFVSELPRNAVGKIQKNLLRETYGSTFARRPVEVP